MKVTCPVEGLLTACQIAQMAVAPRTTKPILNSVKAIAQEDALILMATDLEVGLRYELRGVLVGRPGEAILPVQKLISILRETNDEQVIIDASSESLRVQVKGSKYDLLTAEPDQFPDIPIFDTDDRYHELSSGVLRTLIKRTVFAANKKDSSARYSVNGVLWEAEDGKARMVATDTRRLAYMQGDAEIYGEADEKSGSHLVPLKAITLLERNLSDDGERVRVSLKANDAMFQTERATIYTRLVEGRFPPYQQFIPKQSKVKIVLPVADFMAKVRQAAITSDDEAKRVDFTFSEGKVVMRARGPDVGSSEVVMDLPDYTDSETSIAFDPAYLVEMMRAIEGEPTMILELTDGLKPALFRLGDTYLYIVMPMAERD
jgi:DNA polymerase-3 subunit beta